MNPSSFNELMNDPRITGNPLYLSWLQSKSPLFNWGRFTSYSPDLTAKDISSGVSGRSDIVNKYAAEQTDKATKETSNEAVFSKEDYQNLVEKLNQGLQGDVEDLTNKEVSQGTWNSTARINRLNSLANKYNTSYKGAYDTAAYNATRQGLINQATLGKNVETPSFTGYKTGVTGSSINTPLSTQTYKYNPFQQRSGSIEEMRKFNLSNI